MNIKLKDFVKDLQKELKLFDTDCSILLDQLWDLQQQQGSKLEKNRDLISQMNKRLINMRDAIDSL